MGGEPRKISGSGGVSVSPWGANCDPRSAHETSWKTEKGWARAPAPKARAINNGTATAPSGKGQRFRD